MQKTSSPTNAEHQQQQQQQLQLFSWSSLLFVVLIATTIRLINALLIQTQFDPDEYWQTLEPAYCLAFQQEGYSCHLTWEWTRRAAVPSPADSQKQQWWWWMDQLLQGPARSYVAILPTYWFYSMIQQLGWDTSWTISKGPMLLHAILIAAPLDISVWIAAHFLPIIPKSTDDDNNTQQQQQQPHFHSNVANLSLFFSLASWFNGYALVRTYSNSIEAMLLTVGVALVSPELFSNKRHCYRYPLARSSLTFLLGGLSCAVRCTSVAAWVPLGVLLAIQQAAPSNFTRQLQYLVIPCALFGAIGVGIPILVDRFFYGVWTAPFLGNFHFNAILDRAGLYGTHPFHWYFTAVIPATTGLLLPLVALSFWALLHRRQGPPSSSSFAAHNISQQNLWVIILSYTLTLSLSSHKEIRFLLPILPLFCLVAAVQSAQRPKHWLAGRRFRLAFVIVNMGVFLFLSLVHQRAPLDVNRRIVGLVQQQQKEQQQQHYSPQPPDSMMMMMVVTVDYLMECHSTPLYSHLHVPSVRMVARILDCSPDCRADPNHICETKSFEHDPVAFVTNRYALGGGGDDGTNATTFCVMNNEKTEQECGVLRPLVFSESPTFVVTSSRHAELLRPHLKTMGLEERDRFFHSFHGLKLENVVKETNDDSTNHGFRHVPLFGVVDISFEEIVLFSQYQG